MPPYYFPFFVLALNQTDGIGRSPLRWFDKLVLLCGLWTHVSVVFVVKLVYRLLHRVSLGRLPDSFTNLCDAIVEAKPDRVFVNDANRDEQLFPKSWVLRGKS